MCKPHLQELLKCSKKSNLCNCGTSPSGLGTDDTKCGGLVNGIFVHCCWMQDVSCSLELVSLLHGARRWIPHTHESPMLWALMPFGWSSSSVPRRTQQQFFSTHELRCGLTGPLNTFPLSFHVHRRWGVVSAQTWCSRGSGCDRDHSGQFLMQC